jgi:Zn finger protein HypA/HybF involved in hydrogenase expression
MHEQAIAQEIIRTANEQGNVKGIEVSVGDLAHLPSNEMKDVLVAMTNWDIKIVEVPGAVKCECGFEGEPTILQKGHDSTVFECPDCQMKMPSVTAGDQIVLVGVDVEE